MSNTADNCSEERVENTGNNNAAKQYTHTGGFNDSNHDWNKGEAGALHYR